MDMGVTVTLHDALDVGVAGAAGSLSTTTVTVPGAVMKAGGHWNDKGDGTYTATYTATAVVSGQKAGLKLSGWAGTAESAPYGIAAAPPDATKSTLGRDKDTILADGADKSTLTLTLHDTLDHPVKGQPVDIVTDKGTVRATTDNHDGTYTAELTAAPGTAAGTANITVDIAGDPDAWAL